jgi:hypothetical protein
MALFCLLTWLTRCKRSESFVELSNFDLKRWEAENGQIEQICEKMTLLRESLTHKRRQEHCLSANCSISPRLFEAHFPMENEIAAEARMSMLSMTR